MPSVPLIIGIGNTFRGDDGVGVWVARRLHRLVPYGISVVEATGEAGSLLEAWQGTSTVALIDAACSGAPPGTIHLIDPRASCMGSVFPQRSSHGLGVVEAIELARALDQLPQRLIIYGIEGRSFGLCEELSPVVARAAEKLCEQLRTEASFWSSGVPGTVSTA